MTQTAVEWLIKIYQQTNKIDNFDLEVAKEMEKEQREKDWDEGFEAATKSPDDVPLKISKTVTLNK